MEKTIKTFKKFSEQGYRHYTENTIEELDNLSLDNPDIITEFAHLCEWLRVNHGIWVWVRPYKDHAADNNDPIQHQMNVYKNGVTVSKEFNSHEEAYSAAFDYIKDNNLI